MASLLRWVTSTARESLDNQIEAVPLVENPLGSKSRHDMSEPPRNILAPEVAAERASLRLIVVRSLHVVLKGSPIRKTQ